MGPLHEGDLPQFQDFLVDPFAYILFKNSFYFLLCIFNNVKKTEQKVLFTSKKTIKKYAFNIF